MDSLLLRSAEELFSRHAAPASVRAIRAGGPATVLWEELENAGFLDALVPEAAGGIGLGPAGALPVLMAAGRFAVPLPVGETMLARAALAGVGRRCLLARSCWRKLPARSAGPGHRHGRLGAPAPRRCRASVAHGGGSAG
ncbi:acyl-CoA dehydrogenase family protein [Pseudoroseomonas wenyumeiae]